jgi:hypothetical protein
MACVDLRLVHRFEKSCKVSNVIPLSVYAEKMICKSMLTAKSGIADFCKARERNTTRRADDYCPDNNAA